MNRLLSPTRLRAIEQVEAAKPSREALQELTLAVMREIRTPRAQISIVTADRQFTLAISGVAATGEAFTASVVDPVENSICSWIVAHDQPLALSDTTDFPVVCDMACVAEGGIRAYLGHPISSWTGEPLGAFCVIDYEPRLWTNQDKILLASYANSANIILLQAVLALES